MIKHCAQCEDYLPIHDGYGMCNKDALPVTVIADYEPTKNFLQCQNESDVTERYGEMAYQTDEKTPLQMMNEGWCSGCDGNAHYCQLNGKCEGYSKYKEG